MKQYYKSCAASLKDKSHVKISTVAQRIVVALLISAIATSSVRAQSERWCETDGNYEPAAETMRTVELPEFNIAVSIPENYRTMQRQSGSVEILHPDDFEWIQCLARGGKGGHGYYSETIERVDRNSAISLREQATWTLGYSTNSDGSRMPVATEVVSYQKNGLEGYIVTSISGYSVVFLGAVSGFDRLLQISAGCDCEVEAEALTDLLSRVRPLK